MMNILENDNIETPAKDGFSGISENFRDLTGIRIMVGFVEGILPDGRIVNLQIG